MQNKDDRGSERDYRDCGDVMVRLNGLGLQQQRPLGLTLLVAFSDAWREYSYLRGILPPSAVSVGCPAAATPPRVGRPSGGGARLHLRSACVPFASTAAAECQIPRARSPPLRR